MNDTFSIKIITSLLEWGVQEFYICAGLRNIPIIEVLLQLDNLNVYSHFEERSAAFYALGRIKSIRKPVAVIVTSGTAAGELLPAVMEAYYSGLPLVVVTADRPRKQRNTGAPQTAEQKNLYGIYVSGCIDIENGESFDLLPFPKNKPLHINPCFDVPLLSNKKIIFSNIFKENYSTNISSFYKSNLSDVQNFIKFLNESKNLLVIVSQLCHNQLKLITPFLIKLGAPVYLESISNIREIEELNFIKLKCPDKIWKTSEKSDYPIDSILKIGGTPTHRIWRDLDEIKLDVKIFSISDNVFPGSYRAQHISTDLNCFFESNLNLIFDNKLNLKNENKIKEFIKNDSESYNKIINLFDKFPNSEYSIMHYLSINIKNNSRIYLGNSLPIRIWDISAVYNNKNFYIEASRGLNGIDGQLSTFLGFADESVDNWAILGDLTTLYDLSGPWSLKYRENLSVNVVIINNSGGMIFKGLLNGKAAEVCQNSHSLQFEYWAKMWGIDYERWTDSFSESKKNYTISKKHKIIEVIPNASHSSSFLKEYNEM